MSPNPKKITIVDKSHATPSHLIIDMYLQDDQKRLAIGGRWRYGPGQRAKRSPSLEILNFGGNKNPITNVLFNCINPK